MAPLELQTVLDKERELMNAYAPHYVTHPLFNSYYLSDVRRRFIHWMLRTLRAHGRDPTTLSILQPGSSVGDALEPLAAAGCRRLTGLDIAEDMNARARQRVSSARIIQGSIEHHDFGGERFDVVLGVFILHHMLEPRAFFTMVDRVLAPGGWVFLMDFNGTGWINQLWGKWVFGLMAAPSRRLIKWKNRRRIASQPQVKAMFNPAHRLLRYRQILESMPDPTVYRLRRRTTGLFLPPYNYTLFEDSAFDRALFQSLRAMDTLIGWSDIGYLQWIAAQRTNGEVR